MYKKPKVRQRNQMRTAIIDALKSQGYEHVKLLKPKGGKFMTFLWEDHQANVHESLTTTATRIKNYTMSKWLEEGLFFCKAVRGKPVYATQPTAA